MAQLESAGSGSGRVQRSSSTARDFSDAGINSPSVLSTSSTPFHIGPTSSAATSDNEGDSSNNQAVEDWIAKARESLAEFGGIIGGVSGAGMQNKYLVEEDPDASSGEDGFYTGEEDFPEDFDIAVENSDGEDVAQNHYGRARFNLRHRSSASSLGRPATKKEDSGTGGKLVTLPAEASAFGLMANLSLKKKKKSGDSEGTENAVGLANDDFFRFSTPSCLVRFTSC
jgi:hypothetical protein